MSGTSSGPENNQHQANGPKISSWILGMLIALLALFVVFFIWYNNTASR